METVADKLPKESKFWRRWMWDYSVGELMGIGVATAIGRLLFVNFPVTGSSQTTITVVLLVAAGFTEGAVIGYMQWRSLSKLSSGFPPLLWIFVTTFATLAGWLFILPPGIMFIAFLTKTSLISAYNSVLYTALVGLTFGGLIGIPQYFIVRKHFANGAIWIVSNSIGWMVSFLIIYFSLLAFTGTYVQNLVLIAIACISSGFVQGSITGTSLHYLMAVKMKENKKL